jgi:hypothetical protein
LLSKFINSRISAVIGLAVGYWVGTRWFRQDCQETRRLRETAELDITNGGLEVFTMTGITRVWEILELEDFGPGSVFDAGDADLMYLYRQWFFDEAADGNGEVRPRSHMRVTRWPATREFVDIEMHGEIVPVLGDIDSTTLPIHEFDGGCGLIRREEFPEQAVVTLP